MKDGKHVVLYVEDDPDYLEVVRTVLEANDYIMVGAGSAEEGLRKFKETEPDVVIIDLMMEEVDSGASLVKDLRFHGCEAPIYFLSSVGDMLNIEKDAREMGVEAIFQKPLKPERLISTLNTRLKQK